MWTQAIRVKSPWLPLAEALPWGRCSSKDLYSNPFHVYNHLSKLPDCLFFQSYFQESYFTLNEKRLPKSIHIHTIWFHQSNRSRATPSGYLPGCSCLPLPHSTQPCPSQLSAPVIMMKRMLLWGKPDLLRPNSLFSKLGCDGSFSFPCWRLMGLDFPTTVCDLIFWYKIITCFY